MLGAPRYEDDRLPGQVDAVDVDDPVDLVDELGDGPYPPEALRMAPEGPAGAGHVALPLLGEEPSEEAFELPSGGVVGMGGRAAARLAAPPLGAGLRLAVPLHLGAAGGASLRFHGGTLGSDDFSRCFKNTELGKRRIADTLSVRPEKSVDLTFGHCKRALACANALQVDTLFVL